MFVQRQGRKIRSVLPLDPSLGLDLPGSACRTSLPYPLFVICSFISSSSVWSALPPINLSSMDPPKPIVLAMAAMDSASFFRDLAPGADSPLSGMVALLAAVDALSRASIAWKELPKQLAFFVPTGEAWGYLGSRRFLAELGAGGESTAGLNVSMLHQVLELGSIGKSYQDGRLKVFAHWLKGHPGEKVHRSTQEIVRALKSAAVGMKPAPGSLPLVVEEASRATPGVPPSSLMAFLHHDPALGAVVVEEFDKSFVNPFYESRFDESGNVDAHAITAVATLAARTLLLLAGGQPEAATSVTANASLVGDILTCLFTSDPGMLCPLVTSLLTPKYAQANHYSGVFVGFPSTNPYPEVVDDTARFVWNFLANRTGEESQGLGRPVRPPNETEAAGSKPSGAGRQGGGGAAVERIEGKGGEEARAGGEECALECALEGEVCVASRENAKGRCVVSSTRYVPAYSTRLAPKVDVGWELLPVPPNSSMDAADPVWTESFWQVISLHSYLRDRPSLEGAILTSGLFTTLISVAVIVASSRLYSKFGHAQGLQS